MHDDLDEQDLAFGKKVCETYIRFAWGEGAPWPPYSQSRTWGVFTKDYKIEARSEQEDESCRHYTRWDTIAEKGLMQQFFQASTYKTCVIRN